ncbi:hypothetical protein ABZR37_02390 [Achromobacter ruhlandii]|uniref:hypothetical protein n=1 Tax=Alcaligenaceae TaxID=506 RepID=UPI0011780AEA|nr:hypothetical protein [Bordetella genomosp. 10]
MTLGDVANNITNAIHFGILAASVVAFVISIAFALKKKGKHAAIALVAALICYAVSQKIPSTSQPQLQSQPYQRIQ